MEEKLTIGSSLDVMYNVQQLSLEIVPGFIDRILQTQSEFSQPIILAVKYVWNSLIFLDYFTFFKSTNPISPQCYIIECLNIVQFKYLRTKNFWQIGAISSITFFISKGGDNTTNPFNRYLLAQAVRYLMTQFPPKLVPRTNIGDLGYYFSTIYKDLSISSKDSPVNGIGLVISVFIPLLFKTTHWYPCFYPSAVMTLMQLESLPPVIPCTINNTGGA